MSPVAHSEPDVRSACFIHADLDEAGLTPNQFRVFCHISRRGVCTSSVESIASVCRMHADTVWACLRVLEDHGMIVRTARMGKPTEIQTSPPSAWAPTRNKGVPETKGRPLSSGGGTGNKGVPPTRNKGVQSISLKLIPLSEKAQREEFSLSGELPKPNGSPARVVPPRSPDADWIAGLKSDPAYRGIDVDRELAKAQRWATTNRRQCTRRFFTNWLNRADPAITPTTAKNDFSNGF